MLFLHSDAIFTCYVTTVFASELHTSCSRTSRQRPSGPCHEVGSLEDQCFL